MYIKLKVTAGAREEKFAKISEDLFEISVKEKAERNMANERVIELLRNYFGKSAGIIKIVSGHRSPHKIANIELENPV